MAINHDIIKIVSLILLYIFSIVDIGLFSSAIKNKYGDKDANSSLLTFSIILLIIAVLISFILMFVKVGITPIFLNNPGLSTLIFGLLVIIGFVFLIYGSVVISKGKEEKKGKKEEEKKEEKIPDLEQKCPELVFVSEETLKEIVENLEKCYPANECKSDRSTTCDYLFKQLTGRRMTFEEVDKILDSMTDDALKNQSLYLLYQLVQCRLKLRADVKVEEFGTKEWWYKNIWTNPIQKYIYIISLLITMPFLVYSIFKILGNIVSYLDDNIHVLAFGLFLAVFLCYSVIVFVYGYGADEEYFVKPKVAGEYKSYVGSKEDYKEDPNIEGDKTTTPQKTLTNIMGGTMGVLLIPIIITFIMNYMGQTGFFAQSITYTTIIVIFALIAVFNFYYTSIIPQLILIGLILQKYILQTPSRDDDPIFNISNIAKVILFIVVLFASLFNTTYGTDKNKAERDVYNKPIWFTFGILCAFLIINFVDVYFFDHSIGQHTNQWSMLFIPVFKYLVQFMTAGNIDLDYKDLSVTNKLA